MATNVDIAETNISASQLSEFFRLAAISGNHINRKNFQKFLVRQPISFDGDTEEMFELAGIIDKVRFDSGISEKNFRILWKPEGQIHIKRMFESLCEQLDARHSVLVETKLLKPVAKATVPARTKPFNAAEFYQTGTGLYVYDTFADRLDLNARQTVDSAPERSYVASLLKANAYDKDIRKELPEIHLSTLEDIAGFIVAQPGGKSGFLLSNGYANIFYVEGKNGEVFAVGVDWYSDSRRWSVSVWKLGEVGEWRAGNQVLCPGNAVL